MRTITTSVYKYSELSEKAQENARNEHRYNSDYHFADDNRKTLSEFERIFPVNVKNFEYGGCPAWISHEFTEDQDIADLSGIRLLAYLQNNYHDDLFTGKYYSLWSKTDKNPHYTEKGHAPWGDLKSRHSKVIREANNCPLTGYCIDCDILDPIYKFIESPDSTTFAELMDECLESWVRACESDWEGCQEDDYVAEHIEINEYEFTAEGELV